MDESVEFGALKLVLSGLEMVAEMAIKAGCGDTETSAKAFALKKQPRFATDVLFQDFFPFAYAKAQCKIGVSQKADETRVFAGSHAVKESPSTAVAVAAAAAAAADADAVVSNASNASN